MRYGGCGFRENCRGDKKHQPFENTRASALSELNSKLANILPVESLLTVGSMSARCKKCTKSGSEEESDYREEILQSPSWVLNLDPLRYGCKPATSVLGELNTYSL